MSWKTLALSATLLSGLALGPARAETITMFCGATDYDLCVKASKNWGEKTGNVANINKMPANLDDAIPLFQQLLAARSPDVDVLFLDVIWLGMFKNNLMDLGPLVPKEEQAQHFKATLEAGLLDGKLISMPMYMDVGLMYYRKDLLDKYGLQPPKTWDELASEAKTVQDKERAAGQGDLWGYTWQAKSYEGLTCDAIELVASHGGGTIIDPDGKVTIDNPAAAEAITKAKGWIGTISPEGTLNYDEEASRAVFEAGNSVFHRNWPYVWGTSNGEGSKVAGKVGVMPLPVGKDGQKSSGCLGPMYVAISKYSQHAETAASFVRYITGPEMQKIRAVEGAYNPSIAALYQDQDILAKLPFLKDTSAAFADAATRPSGYAGANYNRVSQTFYRGVHDMLTGGNVESGLKAMAGRIEKQKDAR
ncbi:ABC transporter substrate-binding protein [Aureimonas endophytica]|uniref:ABC transporter substrate-binding protein n=1 Tax=Aureimonas endophytica TaxID=2027858 RepID=A0A916ZIB0_9HYPH|nr:ABC transporter substrate-binding protein [Aureimonas endophytica]GGD99303.1 ABC transporter substrate-binding protein [Aureimonas endophytica]